MARVTQSDRTQEDVRPVERIRTEPAERRSEELIQQTTHVMTPRDRVRWGPIWAGLLMALFTFLTLEFLMYGLGLLTVDLNFEGADRAGTGGEPWMTAIIALISFFAGGFVAGSSALSRSKSAGTLNGFLVAALGLGLILLLSVFGLGNLLGAVGAAVDQFLTASGPFGPRYIPNIDPTRYADELRNAAWWSALSALIAGGAAALGGFVGNAARPDEDHNESY